MRSCPDLCDEVIARLTKLGFQLGDTEDHEPVFAALAQVQFGFTEPVSWTVTIKVIQTTPASELDQEDRRSNPSGEYKEEVEACCVTDAIELAKDQFHARVAIASLDDFQLEYSATRTVGCSRNHHHHVLVPPSDACPCGENDLCNLIRDDADDVHCHTCGQVYHRSHWY